MKSEASLGKFHSLPMVDIGDLTAQPQGKVSLRRSHSMRPVLSQTMAESLVASYPHAPKPSSKSSPVPTHRSADMPPPSPHQLTLPKARLSDEQHSQGRAMLDRVAGGRAALLEVVSTATKTPLSDHLDQQVKKDVFTDLPFRVSIGAHNLAKMLDDEQVLERLKETPLHKEIIQQIAGDKTLTKRGVTREATAYAQFFLGQLYDHSRAPNIETLVAGFPKAAQAELHGTGGYALTKDYERANDLDLKIILKGFVEAGFVPFDSPENIHRLKTLVGQWLVESISPDDLIKEPLTLIGYDKVFDLCTHSTKFGEGLFKFALNQQDSEHSKPIDIAIVRPQNVEVSFDCTAHSTSLHFNTADGKIRQVDYLSPEAKKVLDYFNVDFFKEDNLQRRNKRNVKAGKAIQSTHPVAGFLVNNNPTKFDVVKSIVGGMQALTDMQDSQVPAVQRHFKYLAHGLEQQGLSVAALQTQADTALDTIRTRLNKEVLPYVTSIYQTPLNDKGDVARLLGNVYNGDFLDKEDNHPRILSVLEAIDLSPEIQEFFCRLDKPHLSHDDVFKMATYLMSPESMPELGHLDVASDERMIMVLQLVPLLRHYSAEDKREGRTIDEDMSLFMLHAVQHFLGGADADEAQQQGALARLLSQPVDAIAATDWKALAHAVEPKAPSSLLPIVIAAAKHPEDAALQQLAHRLPRQLPEDVDHGALEHVLSELKCEPHSAVASLVRSYRSQLGLRQLDAAVAKEDWKSAGQALGKLSITRDKQASHALLAQGMNRLGEQDFSAYGKSRQGRLNGALKLITQGLSALPPAQLDEMWRHRELEGLYPKLSQKMEKTLSSHLQDMIDNSHDVPRQDVLRRQRMSFMANHKHWPGVLAEYGRLSDKNTHQIGEDLAYDSRLLADITRSPSAAKLLASIMMDRPALVPGKRMGADDLHAFFKMLDSHERTMLDSSDSSGSNDSTGDRMSRLSKRDYGLLRKRLSKPAQERENAEQHRIKAQTQGAIAAQDVAFIAKHLLSKPSSTFAQANTQAVAEAVWENRSALMAQPKHSHDANAPLVAARLLLEAERQGDTWLSHHELSTMDTGVRFGYSQALANAINTLTHPSVTQRGVNKTGVNKTGTQIKNTVTAADPSMLGKLRQQQLQVFSVDQQWPQANKVWDTLSPTQQQESAPALLAQLGLRDKHASNEALRAQMFLLDKVLMCHTSANRPVENLAEIISLVGGYLDTKDYESNVVMSVMGQLIKVDQSELERQLRIAGSSSSEKALIDKALKHVVQAQLSLNDKAVLDTASKALQLMTDKKQGAQLLLPVIEKSDGQLHDSVLKATQHFLAHNKTGLSGLLAIAEKTPDTFIENIDVTNFKQTVNAKASTREELESAARIAVSLVNDKTRAGNQDKLVQKANMLVATAFKRITRDSNESLEELMKTIPLYMSSMVLKANEKKNLLPQAVNNIMQNELRSRLLEGLFSDDEAQDTAINVVHGHSPVNILHGAKSPHALFKIINAYGGHRDGNLQQWINGNKTLIKSLLDKANPNEAVDHYLPGLPYSDQLIHNMAAVMVERDVPLDKYIESAWGTYMGEDREIYKLATEFLNLCKQKDLAPEKHYESALAMIKIGCFQGQSQQAYTSIPEQTIRFTQMVDVLSDPQLMKKMNDAVSKEGISDAEKQRYFTLLKDVSSTYNFYAPSELGRYISNKRNLDKNIYDKVKPAEKNIFTTFNNIGEIDKNLMILQMKLLDTFYPVLNAAANQWEEKSFNPIAAIAQFPKNFINSIKAQRETLPKEEQRKRLAIILENFRSS
ncbi:hypothetical protein [Agarilytica rhodophyticola]|uniref:hypothetical protein n=1 Tax=Agarilytica rhodophyticola TaxID=1737490 RepID=UPI000B34109B|nr:hypothetical protein [Agarilytica rhodophyticola]